MEVVCGINFWADLFTLKKKNYQKYENDAVHLKLSQHCLLISYTPTQIKSLKKKKRM